jgi:hypothetical protein
MSVMSIALNPANPWPARAAFVAAGIFVSASGSLNVTYGWAKGSDFVSSCIWAAVAGAVAIVFALSWPALIRSLEARRWSTAVAALVALLVAGSYSVTAALGSASGGRAEAANTEVATAQAHKRAQAAYDAATAELGGLKPSRPIAELKALLAAAKPQCRVVVQLGSRQTVCAPPSAMVAELGRAKRRAELEGKAERATAELAKLGPVRQANSDAVAIAGYLSAVGIQVDADRVNRLLVLLTVLVVECGGGLSLSLAMALSGLARTPTEASPDTPDTRPDASSGHTGRPAGHHNRTPSDGASGRAGHPVRPARTDASGGRRSAVRCNRIAGATRRPGRDFHAPIGERHRTLAVRRS